MLGPRGETKGDLALVDEGEFVASLFVGSSSGVVQDGFKNANNKKSARVMLGRKWTENRNRGTGKTTSEFSSQRPPPQS